MKTDIVQKSLLFNSDGTILLLRRSGTDIRRPLQWDFPGGVLDPGETLEDGARREIKEESGIDVAAVSLFFAKTESAEWVTEKGDKSLRNVIRLYYVAHTADNTATISHEHSEYCWVTLEQALTLLEYPRHKEVIKWVIDYKLEL